MCMCVHHVQTKLVTHSADRVYDENVIMLGRPRAKRHCAHVQKNTIQLAVTKVGRAVFFAKPNYKDKMLK